MPVSLTMIRARITHDDTVLKMTVITTVATREKTADPSSLPFSGTLRNVKPSACPVWTFPR